jgi:hypothetical protein
MPFTIHDGLAHHHKKAAAFFPTDLADLAATTRYPWETTAMNRRAGDGIFQAKA